MSQTTTMIFGTFDLLHEGHKSFIQQAKQLSDKLVIVIARDKNVQKIKQKPLWDEKRRQQEVEKIFSQPSIRVVLGDLQDFFQPIVKHLPDIIALGYDQQKDEIELKKELEFLELFPTVVRLNSYKPEIYKTSKIRGS